MMKYGFYILSLLWIVFGCASSLYVDPFAVIHEDDAQWLREVVQTQRVDTIWQILRNEYEIMADRQIDVLPDLNMDI